MKQTICILLGWCLLTNSYAQEPRFISKKALVPYDGVENIRDYLLQRKKRIWSELHTHVSNYKKTNQLPKGVEIQDQTLITRGSLVPALLPIEYPFISIVGDLHSPLSGPLTRQQLINRGMSPQDLRILLEITQGKNEPQEFLRAFLKATKSRLLTDFPHRTDCTSLVGNAAVTAYSIRTLSPLSVPARRAILAYIFEFRTTGNSGYDLRCFYMKPSKLMTALDEFLTTDVGTERDQP